MPNFTKGKWEAGQVIEQPNQWLIFTNRDKPNEHITAIVQGSYRVVAPFQLEALPEQTAANARLIAEAPEMYRLLELCADHFEHIGWGAMAKICKGLLARIDGKEEDA